MTTRAVAPAPAREEQDRRGSRGWRRQVAAVPLWALLVAVVVPPLALAVAVLLHQGAAEVAGDQAVIELAVRESAEGGRSLGPYSRYGWSHPGPIWFYLLAVPYRLLGATSVALHLSVLLLHALTSVLFVGAVDRWAGRLSAAVAAALVLVMHVAYGGEVFGGVWNPYALLLPLALFLLLAAVAMTGSPLGFGGAALTASFLAQTHVGVAPPVAAVAVAVGLVGLPVWWWRGHRLAGRQPLAAGALLLLSVVVWLPPLVQELGPGTGNLSRMEEYATAPRPERPVTEALATVASQLLRLPSLGRAEELPAAAASLGPLEVVALLITVAVSLLLVGAGLRRGRPLAAALGAVTLLLLLASVYAVRQIEGDLFDYLVLWQAVLPVPLVLGVSALVRPVRAPVDDRGTPHAAGTPGEGPDQSRTPSRRLAVPGLVAVAVSGIVGGTVAPSVPAFAGGEAVADALEATTAALPEPSAGAVRVRIGSDESWPLAAGVVLGLEKRGYDARVTRDWGFMFGLDRTTAGSETTEVVLALQEDAEAFRDLPVTRRAGEVESAAGPVSVLVRRASDGGPVPEPPDVEITGQAPVS